MKALSLLGVLILAKAMMLAQMPAWSWWGTVAYFSQDVLVALIVAAIDAAAGRHRAWWVLYAGAVAWIAINVPVALILGSPLTGRMLRAARGPLADSITLYLTTANLLRMAACVLAGAVLPLIVRRFMPALGRRAVTTVVAVAVVFVVLGPAASSRVDTRGLDRNAFTALAPIGVPPVAAAPGAPDWRVSPFDPVRLKPDATYGVRLKPDATYGDLRGAAREMNVVMIVLESASARYLKAYGAAEDPMPNLTELSANALLFENAYAVYPESIKGLFATLCSRYPAFNEPAEAHANVPCASLAASLAGVGYRTALFHSGRFGYLGMQELLQNKGFHVLEDAGAIGGNVHSSFGVDEPAAVDRLLKWVDTVDRGQRFFAAYLPIAGHHPYASTGPFGSADARAEYRNALHQADAAVGQLLAGLRERRLDQSTLLVIFGDHGEAFGEHAGNIGHTLFINDENVKVPYLVVVPGVTTGAVRVASVASVIDTAPTVLDLLGLPADASHQGASLLQPAPRMALFFTDYALGWVGLRDGCWKFLLETGADRSKLYDVCRDPGETRDLSGSAADRVRAYRERARQWSSAQLRLTRNAQAP